MQVKRTGEVGKIFGRYFQALDVENGGQYGNYCFKNVFQFLVCLDEWMGLPFLEDTVWGKIIGLILGMLNIGPLRHLRGDVVKAVGVDTGLRGDPCGKVCK